MKQSDSSWKTLENRRMLKIEDEDANETCRARQDGSTRVIEFEAQIKPSGEKIRKVLW